MTRRVFLATAAIGAAAAAKGASRSPTPCSSLPTTSPAPRFCLAIAFRSAEVRIGTVTWDEAHALWRDLYNQSYPSHWLGLHVSVGSPKDLSCWIEPFAACDDQPKGIAAISGATLLALLMKVDDDLRKRTSPQDSLAVAWQASTTDRETLFATGIYEIVNGSGCEALLPPEVRPELERILSAGGVRIKEISRARGTC